MRQRNGAVFQNAIVKHPQIKLVAHHRLSFTTQCKDLETAAPDAVIIKFWIPFFAPGFFGVTWLLRKRTSIRIVYLLDNVIPHEKYPFGRFLTRLALRQGHGFIAQSDQVRRDLFTVLPDTDPDSVITTPHPVYDFGAPGRPRKTQAEARAALDLSPEARIVLFFGFIKPYKGVVHLIDAAPLLKEKYGDGVFDLKINNYLTTHAYPLT